MLNLFLVDDSSLICQRLVRLLAGVPGTQVVGTAATPEQAIARIAATQPHIVIIDIHLHNGNGITVLKQMADSLPAVIAIVLTSFVTAQMEKACRDAGAKFFFDKATQIGRLCDAVRLIVEDPLFVPARFST
jgi:two-component system OmpR family response regulator